MAHPITNESEVTLSVTESLQLQVSVVSSVYNEVDSSYHYNLQTQFSDGNNAATVQINDVHQSLITEKSDS